MREAGVNLVNLGIFCWVLLEPEPGRYDFGRPDRIIGLLHDGGIADGCRLRGPVKGTFFERHCHPAREDDSAFPAVLLAVSSLKLTRSGNCRPAGPAVRMRYRAHRTMSGRLHGPWEA
jgi:Beta-galactosidase